jgi:hypothetical protein
MKASPLSGKGADIVGPLRARERMRFGILCELHLALVVLDVHRAHEPAHMLLH